MAKSKFIRLSYETFQALIAKKCSKCPLRDGCPTPKYLYQKGKKNTSEERKDKMMRFILDD